MDNKKTIRIYNCLVGACPVVDYNKLDNKITISDPSKPENGCFIMTVEEYNALIKNAKQV